MLPGTHDSMFLALQLSAVRSNWWTTALHSHLEHATKIITTACLLSFRPTPMIDVWCCCVLVCAAVYLPAGGVLLGVVVVAVLAATVLTSKAPGPETLQSVSHMTHTT